MKDNNQNKKERNKSRSYIEITFKRTQKYNIPKCQLLIADIPYNLSQIMLLAATRGILMEIRKNGESGKSWQAILQY